MADSLPDRRPSMPRNSHDARLDGVAPRCAQASMRINDAVAESAILLVFEAIAEAGLSEKTAAYTMGMDPAQLSRVKTGQARLAIDALWRMPDAFWFAFHRRITAAKNLGSAHEATVRAQRIGELVRLLLEAAS